MLNRGDIVEYKGKVTKVVFPYRTSVGYQAHLLNGERNIPERYLKKVNKPLTKETNQMNKTELSQLSKAEINTALGGKYSEAELKKVAKEDLVNEFIKENGIEVKTKKEKSAPKATWRSIAVSKLVESPRNPEEVIDDIINNYPITLFSPYFLKEGKPNKDLLLYKIKFYLFSGKEFLSKKYKTQGIATDEKVQLIPVD